MFTELNLNRLAAYAVALVLIVAAVLLGIRQYGNSRATAQELSTVKEAVQEAVAAREAALVQDVQQANEIVTKRDAVRRAVNRSKNAKSVEVLDCVGDAVGDTERIRLLNLAITDVNAVITAPGELPEGL